MKQIIILFLLTATLAFTSCADSAILPEAPTLCDGSRAIVPEEPSETNPTLLTDWENCSHIYLNETSNSGSLIKVTPPWKDGSITSLEMDFRTDIKKANGWIMLFHTFAKTNKDQGLSYMCFYNQFTGYVKVFYYADREDNATKTIWSVSEAHYKTPLALFSDNEFFSQPLGEKNYTIWSITADNRINKNPSAMKRGWNGFEFRVGAYNPDNAEGDIVIDAYDTTYTTYNFNGEETSTTNGTITTINTDSRSDVKNALAKAVINQTGEQAKNAIDKFVEKNLNKNIIGLNIKDIITGISADDYAKAITSGLGLVFKSFINKGPTYSVSEVKLQTHGTVTLSGNSTTESSSGVNSLPFNLKKILECDRPQTTTNSQRYALLSAATGSKIELGVWNLKKKPTLYYERYTRFDNLVDFPEEYNGTIEFHGIADYPKTHVGDIEVVFNPAIAKYVKSYSVSTSMIDVVGGNRNLDNKNKPLIHYVPSNQLSDDNGVTVYGITNEKRDVSLLFDEVPYDLQIDNSTDFFIDWGTNVGGNRAAVVTLTMEIEYNGQKFNFTESRVYDVVYKPTTNGHPFSFYNNPPFSYVLNQDGNVIYGLNLY